MAYPLALAVMLLGLLAKDAAAHNTRCTPNEIEQDRLWNKSLCGRTKTAVAASASSAAGSAASPDSFGEAFNAAAKRHGETTTVSRDWCIDQTHCSYSLRSDLRLLRPLRIETRGTQAGISSVFAFAHRDLADAAASRRSVLALSGLIVMLLVVLSPDVRQDRRGALVLRLMEGATSLSRVGADEAGGYRFFLNASYPGHVQLSVFRN